MQTELNAKLAALRKRLSENEEAWGPDSELETDHAEGQAGEGGAENVSDVNDVFDNFILGILDSVLAEYDMDEDEAIEYVFDVAASLEEDGTLPPIPDDEDLAGTAEWVGKAASMGFGEMVLSMLEADAEAEE